MYTSPLGCNMAKLYWRVKKNGRWTWKPAVHVDMSWSEGHGKYTTHVLQLTEEEE